MYRSGEYNNAIAHPYSQYSNLDRYHEQVTFGPKFPSTVPSQKYQAILEQPKLASYDVLTLNHTEMQYPRENDAYGTSQPKYYIAESPENKFVRPFVPDIKFTDTLPLSPYGSCGVKNESIVEAYESTLSPDSMDLLEKSKKLDLHIFILPVNKCSFSKKLLDDLAMKFGMDFYKKFTIKNIEDLKNRKLFTDTGGYAVPYFYSPKTNNSQTGYNGKIESIVDSLMSSSKPTTKEDFTSAPQSSLAEKIKSLRIVIYTMKHCAFCTKIKKMLEDRGLLDHVTIHDIATLKDKSKLKGVRGFPHMESHKTGKTYTGCPMTVEMMVDKLS